MPAVRAAVVAEMADIGGGVLVGRPAADAVLRVGRVLERRPRDGRIVEPEHGRPRMRLGERADRRIVAVDDERRIRRQLRHRVPPALDEQLQLPVPVELVAEEIAEADRPRAHPPHHLRQGRLVHLEQPQLGAVGGEKRRRHPGDEVRAGAVVREPVPRPQDLRRHRRGGRLPVRRREDGRTLREPRGETVDRARIELGQELSRHRRPAARAGEARQAGHRAGGGDLGGEGHGQAHGRRAYVSRGETASADPFPQRSELCPRGAGLTHSGDVSLFRESYGGAASLDCGFRAGRHSEGRTGMRLTGG